MFNFEFRLEYTRPGFGIKLGSVWYGFALHKARVSKKQGSTLPKKLSDNDRDVAGYDKFYFANDSNTLYLGLLRILWRQKKDKSLDDVEPYFREEFLNQKADHYNEYKNRENRWNEKE